jgi:ketosteroid isomerase-like protein
MIFPKAILLSLCLGAPAIAQQSAVDDLLAADRAYATASAKTDVISALMPMFSERIVMPTPARTFASGTAEVAAALKANAGNATSKLEWTPIRGGISADGQQGFTFGYMTMHRADGTDTPLKYLSYWVKENGTWKVAAYRRSVRPPGEVSLALMAPSLPAKTVAPTKDTSVVGKFAASLAAAEQSFSDEAAVIGLGPAFEKFGRADAMNMGGASAFTFGNIDIAKGVGGQTPTAPSPLAWKSDFRVIVASSGDLGVSIGYIRINNDPAAQPIPFFTVWRRDSVDSPWRYIAE